MYTRIIAHSCQPSLIQRAVRTLFKSLHLRKNNLCNAGVIFGCALAIDVQHCNLRLQRDALDPLYTLGSLAEDVYNGAFIAPLLS